MVNIQISLPEDVARNAQERGLLEPDAITELLRAEMRRLAFDYILGIADQLEAAGIAPMTDEEIPNEIRAYRAEQNHLKST